MLIHTYKLILNDIWGLFVLTLCTRQTKHYRSACCFGLLKETQMNTRSDPEIDWPSRGIRAIIPQMGLYRAADHLGYRPLGLHNVPTDHNSSTHHPPSFKGTKQMRGKEYREGQRTFDPIMRHLLQ